MKLSAYSTITMHAPKIYKAYHLKLGTQLITRKKMEQFIAAQGVYKLKSRPLNEQVLVSLHTSQFKHERRIQS